MITGSTPRSLRQRREARRLGAEPGVDVCRGADSSGDTCRRCAWFPPSVTCYAQETWSTRYAEPLDVGDLAEAAGLSRAHFSREFKRAFGESPHAYLLTRRLERAAALLRATDRSIAAICFAVGLRSVGSFTSSFTRTYGMTPTAYRASFPPASPYVLIPACILRAHGRPQHRTFREDAAPARP
jgi:AraC-like DNA-binding protein